MARLSLYGMVSMLFGVPTCLVTNTTEFPQPVPSAPYINPNNALATPEGEKSVAPTSMIFIDPGTDTPGIKDYKSLTLTATVQSEDNGRPLYARAYGNFQVGEFTVPGGGDNLDPSTFDDVRTISATLAPQSLYLLGPGCHQVALVASHVFDVNQPFLPPYASDTSFVVWWLLIEHDDGNPDTPGTFAAATCPPGKPAPMDAGTADAEAGP